MVSSFNYTVNKVYVQLLLASIGSAVEIELGSSAHLMEQRSSDQVSPAVLNKLNIRHLRDHCRKQQILLLLLCCLNGSSKENRC